MLWELEGRGRPGLGSGQWGPVSSVCGYTAARGLEDTKPHLRL